jgi:hypothetical protein
MNDRAGIAWRGIARAQHRAGGIARAQHRAGEVD